MRTKDLKRGTHVRLRSDYGSFAVLADSRGVKTRKVKFYDIASNTGMEITVPSEAIIAYRDERGIWQSLKHEER